MTNKTNKCFICATPKCCEGFETTRLGSIEIHLQGCQCNQSPPNTEMSKEHAMRLMQEFAKEDDYIGKMARTILSLLSKDAKK
jgi:hypothetical protein